MGFQTFYETVNIQLIEMPYLFCRDKAKLEWILNPIIHSAADLMISQELRKVKKCSDPVCGWLFLDISEMNYRQPNPKKLPDPRVIYIRPSSTP